MIEQPRDIIREGYVFTGWDSAVPDTMPAENLTFTALWEKPLCSVRFVNDDGTQLQSENMKPGDMPVYKGGIPRKKTDGVYTYLFKGWTPTIHTVTEDVVYTATYYATPLYQLIAAMQSSGSTGMKISWTKVSNASGYDVFFARCDSGGKKYVLKCVKTVNATSRSHVVTGMKKNLCYKAVVRAFRKVDGKKVYIAASPMVHAVSGGSKQLKATVKGIESGKKVLSQDHAALVRYYSSNKAVATVNASGKIKAVGKGTCLIYALTPNGICKKVKVTVK